VDDKGLDLLRGTLDLLILKALAWQPLHGYAAAKWVRAASRETLEIDDRALYIALHRLEAGKLIRGRWQTSATGRKAKCYELTTAGRARLKADLTQWEQYVRAMGYVLRAKPAEQP
jgi:PadR family transcriptional regulator, regulatory protein PadR